jgi:hypothetical protein
MPVVLRQFATGLAATVDYWVALHLAKLCAEQYEFNVALGPGGGIAGMSCWAAVAVQPNAGAGYPVEQMVNAAGGLGATMGPLGFSAVFGNSRMASINAAVPVPGAPPGGFSSHAERNALITANANGLALHNPAVNTAVLYVQLAPCPPCAVWLGGGGGGIPNPFAAAIGGALTLYVWYRWPYTAPGTGAMRLWNLSPRAVKHADINLNW